MRVDDPLGEGFLCGGAHGERGYLARAKTLQHRRPVGELERAVELVLTIDAQAADAHRASSASGLESASGP
jgi:hypothetical protein